MKLTDKTNDKSESAKEIKDSIREADRMLSDDDLDHVSGGIAGSALSVIPGTNLIAGPVVQNTDLS